jgi:hypothetical protein
VAAEAIAAAVLAVATAPAEVADTPPTEAAGSFQTIFFCVSSLGPSSGVMGAQLFSGVSFPNSNSQFQTRFDNQTSTISLQA